MSDRLKFNRYMQGWRDGASCRAYAQDNCQEYDAGYRTGRECLREASKLAAIDFGVTVPELSVQQEPNLAYEEALTAMVGEITMLDAAGRPRDWMTAKPLEGCLPTPGAAQHYSRVRECLDRLMRAAK